jgi:hypothetical protein
MPLLEQFENFEQFCQWYQQLVPSEPLDKHEAATIYFNLENFYL